jgi:REP element-mobilizing transposase RayT
MDRYLDTTRLGPMYLAQESLAGIVVASLHRGALLGHYELGANVVMSNHGHVLLLPRISPSNLIQSLTGATAREANRVLGRTGETFWQAESYDHWVRDEKEWERIAAYIENNPVKAGLIQRAEDFCCSSVAERSAETPGTGPHPGSLGAADTSVRATFAGVGTRANTLYNLGFRAPRNRRARGTTHNTNAPTNAESVATAPAVTLNGLYRVSILCVPGPTTTPRSMVYAS